MFRRLLLIATLFVILIPHPLLAVTGYGGDTTYPATFAGMLLQALADPEVQDLLIDLIEYGLAALGVSTVWIVKARKIATRAVPLLVSRAIVLHIAHAKDSSTHIGPVEVSVKRATQDAVRMTMDRLPKVVSRIPTVRSVITKSAAEAATRILDSKSPIPAASGFNGSADFIASANKLGVTSSVRADDRVSLGAGVSYDVKTNRFDWGGNIKFVF